MIAISVVLCGQHSLKKATQVSPPKNFLSGTLYRVEYQDVNVWDCVSALCVSHQGSCGVLHTGHTTLGSSQNGQDGVRVKTGPSERGDLFVCLPFHLSVCLYVHLIDRIAIQCSSLNRPLSPSGLFFCVHLCAFMEGAVGPYLQEVWSTHYNTDILHKSISRSIIILTSFRTVLVGQ